MKHTEAMSAEERMRSQAAPTWWRSPSPPGFEALIGIPDFEVGHRYLITATDGVVNGSGYSGPVTPDLEVTFDVAFGS